MNQDLEMINSILNTHPTLSEQLFSSKYVHLLFNLDSVHKKNEWAAVAGNLFNKVNVIDKDGNTLFWVPPVFVKASINDRGANYFEFLSLIRRIRDGGNVAKANAMEKKYLSGNLNTQKIPDEYKAQWQMIFKKYNLIKSSTRDKKELDEVYEEFEKW